VNEKTCETIPSIYPNSLCHKKGSMDVLPQQCLTRIILSILIEMQNIPQTRTETRLNIQNLFPLGIYETIFTGTKFVA
jgi:hypothetical protein